jgi:hypothetical protein
MARDYHWAILWLDSNSTSFLKQYAHRHDSILENNILTPSQFQSLIPLCCLLPIAEIQQILFFWIFCLLVSTCVHLTTEIVIYNLMEGFITILSDTNTLYLLYGKLSTSLLKITYLLYLFFFFLAQLSFLDQKVSCPYICMS